MRENRLARVDLGKQKYGSEILKNADSESVTELETLLKELESKWTAVEKEEDEAQKKEKSDIGEQMTRIKEKIATLSK